MINIKSPINKSTLYSNKVYVEYLVEQNSKFTDKVIFIIDGIRYEKTELSGSFSIENVSEGKHTLRAYLVNKSNNIIVGSEKKLSFQTNDDVIVLNNRLSDVVSSQIPSFIREDYNNFVVFIEKYYQFLEQTNEPNKVPFAQSSFSDVDYTPEILLQRFKKLFIPDFPDELTVDQETGRPLNIKTLIKRAKQFYETKGTEKSFSFLFKVLFDGEMEIFYPRTQMMIVSGGLWIQEKSIKALVLDMDRARALEGNIIYQKDSNGNKINKARVSKCSIYVQSPYKVVEFFLEEVYGSFFAGKFYSDVIYQDAEETIEFTARRGIGNIEITNGGSNYKIGDVVRLTPNSGSIGVGYSGKVSKINSLGSILEIQSVDFGFNYEQIPTGYSFSITSVGGSGFVGVPESTVLCSYAGYYKNANSILGNQYYIQDNDYYQTHSYEIKTNVQSEKYKDIIKRMVHPAGYKMFTELSLTPVILNAPTTLNNIGVTISTFIGNLLPYTINSSKNLRQDGEDLFPDGFNPEQPIPPQDVEGGEFVHDPLGNPISTNIKNAYFAKSRILPSISDINDKRNYWVVFPHPNTNLNTNETGASLLELTIQDLAIITDTTNSTNTIGDSF